MLELTLDAHDIGLVLLAAVVVELWALAAIVVRVWRESEPVRVVPTSYGPAALILAPPTEDARGARAVVRGSR